MAVQPSKPESSVASSLREQAELRQCLAGEWQRDGRGLWAGRFCQCVGKHVNHAFTPWQLHVQPPGRAEALREAHEAFVAGWLLSGKGGAMRLIECEYGDCPDHYSDPAAWCRKCALSALAGQEPKP